jgi:hypothetical protein
MFCGQTVLFAIVMVVEVDDAVQFEPEDGALGFDVEDPDPPHAIAATSAATITAHPRCHALTQDSSRYFAR